MQATQHRSGADTTEAKELRKGDQQVDGKDEDFTHRADRTITAGTRKTARRVLIASHYEFATHRHCARARAAGATIVEEPSLHDYGEAYWARSRRLRCNCGGCTCFDGAQPRRTALRFAT